MNSFAMLSPDDLSNFLGLLKLVCTRPVVEEVYDGINGRGWPALPWG